MCDTNCKVGHTFLLFSSISFFQLEHTKAKENFISSANVIEKLDIFVEKMKNKKSKHVAEGTYVGHI